MGIRDPRSAEPMVLVPASPTHRMKLEGSTLSIDSGVYDIAHDLYQRMISTAPGRGAVSAADLERAAEAAWDSVVGRRMRWATASERLKQLFREDIAAALGALGLSVARGAE